MRKNYLKLLAATICMLPFANAGAQTYSAGDIVAVASPTMSHDTTTCSSNCMLMYNITISSSFLGDSVKIVDIGSASLVYSTGNATGATTWSFMAPVPIFNPVITDDMLMGGPANFVGPTIKIICGADTIHSIPNAYTLPVTDPCQYGNVSGMVYVDNNSDCAYNTGDVPLNVIPVTSLAHLSSPMGIISASAFSGSTGAYNMTVQESWMTNYNVTLPSSYYFIFPHTSCFSGAYTYTTLPQVNVDFPLQCTSAVDAQCSAGGPPNVRVGTPFFMHPSVSNTGCDTVSGVLTFVKDSRTIYNASLSTNPATSVSGDTLRWNYNNLTNLTGGGYWNSFISGIHLTPDATVHISDTLCFRVYTGVPSTDVNPANNDYTICLPVVYSYDPNMKEVSPRGTGTTGNVPVSTSQLNYTLHFQNTGTAPAFTVKIIDTLDGDINAQSLKILGSTHRMEPQWLAPGVVQFTFNGIMLPDSLSNEPASHGSVSFSVKLNTGLPVGTQIKNKGYIYFDSNPPIITNTAINTLTNPSSVVSVTGGSGLNIYPNPATDKLYVENLQNGDVSIMNINGQVMITHHVGTASAAVDISKIPAGVYIIKTVSKDNTTTGKFVKQ